MNNSLKSYLLQLLIIAIVVFAISNVLSNVLEESISGSGTIHSQHMSASASDDAGAKDARYLQYKIERVWGPGQSASMKSDFSAEGTSSSGGHYNRYIVKSSGAGYKHQYRVYFSGDFTGSSEVTLTFAGATESLDSRFVLDSTRGNASFQGRIYNGRSGRPMTEAETDAVGSFIIDSYLNISQTEPIPEDWLGFCDAINRDISDELGLEGIYILPANTSMYNYTIDVDGRVHRSLNTSRVL